MNQLVIKTPHLLNQTQSIDSPQLLDLGVLQLHSCCCFENNNDFPERLGFLVGPATLPKTETFYHPSGCSGKQKATPQWIHLNTFKRQCIVTISYVSYCTWNKTPKRPIQHRQRTATNHLKQQHKDCLSNINCYA